MYIQWEERRYAGSPCGVEHHFRCNKDGATSPCRVEPHFRCNEEEATSFCCIEHHFQCDEEGFNPPCHAKSLINYYDATSIVLYLFKIVYNVPDSVDSI